jgi:light-regulated signal transduction histidine kinase (bacteriophytochrome)
MKKLIFLILIFFMFSTNVESQISKQNHESVEAIWDQGVPICPGDASITALIDKVGFDNLRLKSKAVSKEEAKTCREIGIAFYNREMYEAADWYLARVKSYVEIVELEPEIVFESPKEEVKMSEDDAASLQADKAFLQNLPQSYDDVSPADMKKLANEIGNKLKALIAEKEALLASHAPQEVIDAKEATIGTLGKEKEIIDLSIKTDVLEVEVDDLEVEKKTLTKWLWWAGAGILVAFLAIIALLQRKTIKVQDSEIERQLEDINKKNTYLEYAARIIRHDMHSGINTYMPRGLSGLQKRITPEIIADLKIGSSIQMIQEGLLHTQKVYKNVYEFTNLVKVKSDFKKEKIDAKISLEKYLANTSYGKQVEIGDLGEVLASEQLLCNALDNLIKNGLKYNDNSIKTIKIYTLEDFIIVEDNGTGLTSQKFEEYVKRGVDIESETGLGLGIAKAIIEEHGFELSCEEIPTGGTKMKIKITNKND